MRTPLIVSLYASLMLAHAPLSAESGGGRVVWWTADPVWTFGRGASNGVVIWEGEVLTNIVAITAAGMAALLLTDGGEVLSCRTTVDEAYGPMVIDG
jgi:hypothetical protein